jgi:hypothetical protein
MWIGIQSTGKIYIAIAILINLFFTHTSISEDKKSLQLLLVQFKTDIFFWIRQTVYIKTNTKTGILVLF